MSKIYVLDTGVLVSTWTDKKKESEFITTPQIIGEIRNRLSRFRAETLFLLDKMEERTPNEEDVQKTEAAAASKGNRAPDRQGAREGLHPGRAVHVFQTGQGQGGDRAGQGKTGL